MAKKIAASKREGASPESEARYERPDAEGKSKAVDEGGRSQQKDRKRKEKKTAKPDVDDKGERRKS